MHLTVPSAILSSCPVCLYHVTQSYSRFNFPLEKKLSDWWRVRRASFLIGPRDQRNTCIKSTSPTEIAERGSTEIPERVVVIPARPTVVFDVNYPLVEKLSDWRRARRASFLIGPCDKCNTRIKSTIRLGRLGHSAIFVGSKKTSSAFLQLLLEIFKIFFSFSCCGPLLHATKKMSHVKGLACTCR